MENQGDENKNKNNKFGFQGFSNFISDLIKPLSIFHILYIYIYIYIYIYAQSFMSLLDDHLLKIVTNLQ